MSISALKEKFNSLTLESENHWDYRGNNNSERDYVHGFCTYPAMMVPKMQREMLDVCLEHLQDTSIRLLDPFAGSGTILVEGMLDAYAVDAVDLFKTTLQYNIAGNRKVAKQEIFMDKIMIELCKPYYMQLLTNFTRQILNKRMPKLNGYQGEEKGLQSTMTREHILIFVRSDSKNEQPAHPI